MTIKSIISMVLWVFLFGMSGFAIDIKVGQQVADDPYFQMNSSNLNTMNSYIIPAQARIDDVTSYPTIKYELKRDPNMLLWFRFIKTIEPGYSSFHLMSSYVGFAVLIVILLLIRYFGVKRSRSSFGEALRLLFDGIRNTFADILWPKASYNIKMYVVWLFFLVLLSNLLAVFSDVLRFAFPQMLRRVTAPTAEFETTLALAFVATIIPLGIQIKNLGVWWFLYEYVPITGKWLMEWGTIGAKIADIGISLFVWLLDMIGIISKIISLSMRLFGNMSSWSILLNVAFLWLWGLFVWLWWANTVIGIPIILYLQWLLVAVVQAFVFAMLTSIGIKLVLEE